MANLVVADASAGAADGSDWNNPLQWSTFTPVRGNTYYIKGGGTYVTKTLSTAVSGTTVITIKGATVADHGPATGWDATYSVDTNDGGSRANFDGGPGMSISTSYWTIDGAVGNGSLNNGSTTGYGFRSRSTSDGNGAVGIHFTATPLVGITVRHYEVDGIDACSMPDTDNSVRDCFLSAGGGDVDGTFEYIYAHDIGRTMFLMGGNITLQYCYMARNRSVPAAHAEAFAYRGGAITVRWNIFEDIRGTGCFVALYSDVRATTAEIYGNVFRVVQGDCLPYACTVIEYPVIDNTAQGFFNGLKFYNNTITGYPGSCGIGNTHIPASTGYDIRNNLWVNNSLRAGIAGDVAEDYNTIWGTYWNEETGGANTNWRCLWNGGADPSGLCAGNNELQAPAIGDIFVSAPGDLRPKGNTIGGFSITGVDLGAPYNVDMNGNTRTNWTRGAYEYVPSGTYLMALG